MVSSIPAQVFVVEQHSKPISDGPAVVFSALIPDMDHFKGSEGGRALPILHPNGRSNLAPGLVPALSAALGGDVTPADMVAYLAAVCAHPAYTQRFTDELTTPGVRVPMTADSALWTKAVILGRQVLWAHTYGAAFSDDEAVPGMTCDTCRARASGFSTRSQ